VPEYLEEYRSVRSPAESEPTEPWQKMKFDWQIVAISVVEAATATDKDIHNRGVRWGIRVVSPADIPIPILQPELDLPELDFGR
jgi:hypothetical protein